MKLLPGTVGLAIFNHDHTHRFLLQRRWGDPTQPTLTWVMLNPSIANDENDDPTIRAVCAFSDREGYGAIRVVNLYSLIATSPARLYGNPASDNDGINRHAIEEACRDRDVVVAWGATVDRMARNTRPYHVDATAGDIQRLARGPLRCLGVTASGQPRHPLRLAHTTPLIEWPPQ